MLHVELTLWRPLLLAPDTSLYREVLARSEPGRTLYMAVSVTIQETLFEEPIGRLMLETQSLRLLVFDPLSGRIAKWMP